MNRLQDCFDDDDAGDVSGGPMFQGMRHDPSMALIDFRPRNFSPALHDWMATEPVAYVDGLNVHAAPVDEPVNPINPSGI